MDNQEDITSEDEEVAFYMQKYSDIICICKKYSKLPRTKPCPLCGYSGTERQREREMHNTRNELVSGNGPEGKTKGDIVDHNNNVENCLADGFDVDSVVRNHVLGSQERQTLRDCDASQLTYGDTYRATSGDTYPQSLVVTPVCPTPRKVKPTLIPASEFIRMYFQSEEFKNNQCIDIPTVDMNTDTLRIKKRIDHLVDDFADQCKTEGCRSNSKCT